MENKTVINDPQQKSGQANNHPSHKKLIVFLVTGLTLGLIIAAAVYFLILKDQGQEETKEESDTQTTATQAIDPATYKYDTYIDTQKHFSFKYPTQSIRMNSEDIDKTVSEEVKTKYKMQILFVAVLQDDQSVVQIMAESFEFDPNVTLSDTYKELLELNEDQGTSVEITKEQTSDNELATEADLLIGEVSYKSLERMITRPEENGVIPAYAISVIISESIFDEYVNVGKYVVESALVGDSLEEGIDINSDVVKNIYLGRFPSGSSAPANGEGITATTTFNKSDDLICLVTDLEETTTGFSIEVLDKSNNNLITSDYNVTLEKGVSSGCDQISFGPGEFILKISRNSETIEEIDFTVE